MIRARKELRGFREHMLKLVDEALIEIDKPGGLKKHTKY